MDAVAEVLLKYLRDVIHKPTTAVLDIEALPVDFKDLGKGIHFFAECVVQSMALANAMSKGDLNSEVPPRQNEIAAPLKSLHASLRHLTWQAQQIAKGDYRQNVDFLGDFSISFNAMTKHLKECQ